MRNGKYSSIRVGAALVAALVTGGAGAHKGACPYKLMSGGPGGAVAEAPRWPMLRAAWEIHPQPPPRCTQRRPPDHPPVSHSERPPLSLRAQRGVSDGPTPAAGLHARDSSRSMRNDKYSSIRVGAALVAALVTAGAGAHKGRPYKLMSGGPGGAVAQAPRWPMLRAAWEIHPRAPTLPHRRPRITHLCHSERPPLSLRAQRGVSDCPTPAAGLHARDSSRSMRNDKYSSIRTPRDCRGSPCGCPGHRRSGRPAGRPYKLMSGGPGGAVAEARGGPCCGQHGDFTLRGRPCTCTRAPLASRSAPPVTPSTARSLRCPTPAAGLHARDSSRSMRNDKYSSIRVGAALVAALVTGGAGAHKGRPYTAVCGRRSVPTTSTGSTRRGRAGDRTRSVGARIQTAPPPPAPCHTDQLTCKANSSPSTS